MRHKNSGRKFSRSPAHRKALLMNLAKALLTHGRICTTEPKAKDLRGVVEPLITLAKKNSLHARRLAYRQLNDHSIVKHLFDNVGPVFAEVNGGYTRVTKLARWRKGDAAPMAVIEFSREIKAENTGVSAKAAKQKAEENVSAKEAAAGIQKAD